MRWPSGPSPLGPRPPAALARCPLIENILGPHLALALSRGLISHPLQGPGGEPSCWPKGYLSGFFLLGSFKIRINRLVVTEFWVYQRIKWSRGLTLAGVHSMGFDPRIRACINMTCHAAEGCSPEPHLLTLPAPCNH